VHEHLIGVYADAECYLVHASAFTLKARKGIIHPLIGYQAAVHAKKAVASPLHEPDFAPPFRCEPDVIAIAPRVLGGESRRDGRVFKATDPPQLLAHDMLLEGELAGIGDVLPLTTAADTEVRTKGLDAIGRGIVDFDDPAHYHTRAAAQQLDGHSFAGYPVLSENRARTVAGQRASLERDIFEPNGDALRRVDSIVWFLM